MGDHLLHNDLRAAELPRAVSAKGVWIVDAEGNRYLDGCSGAIVSSIGHGHRRVVQAITAQAALLTFAHRTAFSTQPLTELADRLCAFTGYDTAWFVGSGSEAAEAAIQLAVQYHRERGEPERTWFLSLRRGYHGNTLGGLSLSGNARRSAVGSLVHNFPVLPTPYAYREQGELLEHDWVEQMISSARQAFAAHEGRVAAVMLEPVGGATMGATVPPIAYLQGLRALCDEHGALFIADEVMTGMGRCGTVMAAEQFGVRPDIATMGKGLGAGYAAIAATLLREHVREELRGGSGRILGGHTYAGNPLSAATALAVIDVYETEGVIANGVQMGQRLAAGLAEIAAGHELVGDARGLGMLHAIELVTDPCTKALAQPLGSLAQALAASAKAEGLVLYPATGGINDALIVAPPLTISADEVDVLLVKLQAALRTLTH